MLRVFFLQSLDKSRVPTEETTHVKPRGDLERAAPRRGSSYCWLQASSGVGDAPRANGRHAAARGTGPLPRTQTTASLRERPTEKKGRTRRPATRIQTRVLCAPRHACSARADARAPRAQTRLLRAHRRAHSGALTRRVSRRRPARFPTCRPARLPARNRHVLRRTPDASTDAYSARLEARSRHASAACEVFAF